MEAISEKFDIILCSQFPISDNEILSKVDFYFYDKQDIESFADYGIFIPSPNWYYYCKEFNILNMFDNAYHFNVWRLTHFGISITKSYDFFYYIEGDVIINKPEMEDLIQIRNRMFENDKRLIFFNTQPNDDSYLATIFGGVPNFFIDNIKISPYLEDWVGSNFLPYNSLEMTYKKELSKIPNDIYSVAPYEFYLKIRPNSERLDSLSTPDGFKRLLYFNEDDLYIFYYNQFDDAKRIQIYLNDDIIRDSVVYSSVWFLDKLNIENLIGKKIMWIVYDGEKEFFKKSYFLDNKKISILKKTNIIKIL